MTNYQHFQCLTDGVNSPVNFLEAAWYFAVTTALERRVWFGDEQRALRTNQFILLVGPPAIGKGLALREAKRLLSRYPLTDDRNQPIIDPLTHKERPRFYQLPDASSYEQLCHEVAESKLTSSIKVDGIKIGEETHCSTYFCLEELSSLLRLKKSEDIARLLLNMYDGEPYKYKVLRTGGSAFLDNGCMNFLAGTTPDFLRNAEEQQMIGEGLASRFMMVVAHKPRYIRFGLPPMTDAQRKSQEHLQKWLYSLSFVRGEAKTTPDVDAWLQDWWAKEAEHLLQNYEDEKLANYFSRRQVQVIKLAIARHFGEHRTMTLTIDDFEFASNFVRALEMPIVNIAKVAGRNSLYSIQERFYRWLCKHPGQTINEIMEKLSPDLETVQIAETLKLYTDTGKIFQSPQNQKYYPKTDETEALALPGMIMPSGAQLNPNVPLFNV